MGYVIGIGIIISLLLYIANDAPILFCAIIGVVVWAIAYFLWGAARLEKINKQLVALDRRDRAAKLIKNNSAEISEMKNSEFFEMLIDNIWNFNTLLFEDIINRTCTYSDKPVARRDMLAYPNITVSATKITNGIGYGSNSSDILFSDLGFRDLNSKQIEILGMALATERGYKPSENAYKDGFSTIIADWSYWKPRIEKRIETVYKEKTDEYNRTHKVIC